jgi:hypothetical protein
VRLLLLGDRRGFTENRWKDDLADAGTWLGWDVLHINARDCTTADVVRLARGRDLLLWARTHGHEPDGDGYAMLRDVEDMGVVTASLHLDLYWTIPRREAQIGAHPFWSSRFVFTADGAPRDWASKGVNHHWCPPAMGHRYLGRGVADRRKYPHHAVFVGTCSKHVHGLHRVQLLQWATKRWGSRFGRYGGKGEPKAWGADLSDMYATVPVVLGDSAAKAYAWSDRLPVTLGRGGLLAFPRIPGMAEQGFTDDVLITYRRFDFDHIADRLAQVNHRDMTDAALTLIEERHMWTHRLQMIARTVGLA